MMMGDVTGCRHGLTSRRQAISFHERVTRAHPASAEAHAGLASVLEAVQGMMGADAPAHGRAGGGGGGGGAVHESRQSAMVLEVGLHWTL